MIDLKNYDCLIRALEYIENHIGEEISSEALAEYSLCSLSSLQKLFRMVCDYSIKEYISKRRLTLAARELVNTDKTVLEIAFQYGYNSPENFTRAFRKLWNKNPGDYRKTEHYADIFPQLVIDRNSGTAEPYRHNLMLFDVIKNNPGCPILCFDLTGLTKINEISRMAGDAAIMETLRRINELRYPDAPLFRLGGDEFAMLVPGADNSYCEMVMERIAAQNQTPLLWEGKKLPIMIRVWIGTNMVFANEKEATQILLERVRAVGS